MIICLGEALIDLIPDNGASVHSANALTIQPGGAPFNVAVALNRLGVPVTFAGMLSTDRFGDRLRALLARECIDRVPRHTTPAGTRLSVVDPGNTVDTFRFYGDQPADSQLSMDDAGQALETEVDGLYLSSLIMTESGSAEAQHHAATVAGERRIPIFTDPNPRPGAWADLQELQRVTAWLLSIASVAKLSLDDAYTLGWTGTPETLVRRAKEQWSTELIVTDGDRGCWFNTPGGVEHLKAFPTVPVDPTGAGDAFFAALISKYVESRTLTTDAMRYAAAAGALTTMLPGAIQGFPPVREIEALAASRS